MRDRLIEQIQDRIIYHSNRKRYHYEIGKGVMSYLANDLIGDFTHLGGLLPPCKIGDTVYTLGHGNRKHPKEWEVIGVWFSKDPSCNYIYISWYKDKDNFETKQVYFVEIGKTVFLSREDAERALRKEDEGK